MVRLPRLLALGVLLWNVQVFAEPSAKSILTSPDETFSCTGLCLAAPPNGKTCYEPTKLAADPCKDIPTDATCIAAATIAQASCGSSGAIDCLSSLVGAYSRTVCVSYPALGNGGVIDEVAPPPPPVLPSKIG